MASVWRVLAGATAEWQQLRQRPAWWWAFIAHWLLLLFMALLNHRSMIQLSSLAGFGPRDADLSPGLVAGLAVALAVSVTGGLLFAALLGSAALLAIGVRESFSRILTWAAYGLIPVTVGQFAGGLVFSIVRPLTESATQALALGFRPYSFGLAAFMQDRLVPLSFGWFTASYLDAFAVWSLVLLLIGARHLFGLKSRELLWLGLELVLVSFVVITALWLAGQQLLVGLAG